LFLWLRFPHLSISTAELYERLKRRGVLIVPGTYFFFGLHEPWSESNACIRLTYSMAPEVVRSGIEILADEVGRCSMG
jgi:valine--pyruvate aminotransferase